MGHGADAVFESWRGCPLFKPWVTGRKDLLIDATALLHGWPVITRNLSRFERVPRLTVSRVLHEMREG